MTHLGTRISALVDGQLPPGATERALAHVAVCPGCAAELAAARQAHRALSCAQDVAPTADLTARLLSLASEAPAEPRPSHRDPFVSPSGAPAARARAAAYAAPGALTGDVDRRAHPVRVVGAVVAGLGVAACGLFVLGERPAVLPSSHPAQALVLLGHTDPVATAPARVTSTVDLVAALPDASQADAGAGSAGEMTAGTVEDVLDRLRAAGWHCPEGLPDGWVVTGVRTSEHGSRIEVDLAGPGASAVVTEQPGRLDTAALAGVAQVVSGDRRTYVLSEQPWHVAWQSGDLVVEVVAASDSLAVQAVVTEFPGGSFDDGLSARMTRGWDTVTQALRQS
ncbi:zf-HC2 domain-containing protein [Cellulomonas sp. P22]|uniref:zf-HC2 domain-containing protein n=1 Tax=Cellulomonas sp. P22 TaxID=3373189 RepID=UPI0037AC008A